MPYRAKLLPCSAIYSHLHTAKMVQRILWALILWVGLSSWVLADGFREQFRAAFKANDLPAAEKVLADWEKATPKDPDLYVARFNFLLNKATQRTDDVYRCLSC